LDQGVGNLAVTARPALGHLDDLAESGAVRRIHPAVGPFTSGGDDSEVVDNDGLDQLYGGERPVTEGRPWVGLCMIASLDGSTVVDGRSGRLGNDGDRAVFSALRRAADTIIVGSATARAEAYRAPRQAGQRIGVVTSTGDVDRSTDLFDAGAGFLMMPTDGPPAPTGIDVVRAGKGRVNLALALARLDSVMEPPRFVQSEGGSRLNGALLDAGCVDELNLSCSPVMAGGDGNRLVTGAAVTWVGYLPAHVLIDDDGYLFTRWVRRSSGPDRR